MLALGGPRSGSRAARASWDPAAPSAASAKTRLHRRRERRRPDADHGGHAYRRPGRPPSWGTGPALAAARPRDRRAALARLGATTCTFLSARTRSPGRQRQDHDHDPQGPRRPCGYSRTPGASSRSPALVTEVDRIFYDNSSGISDLVLEDPATFEPGKAAEQGREEIEIVVASPTGASTTWSCATSTARRPLRLRVERAAPFAVNLNPSDPVPDADITLVTPFFANFVAEGGPGADIFTGAGGAGVGGPYMRQLTLRGGAGADTLTGGGGQRLLHATIPATMSSTEEPGTTRSTTRPRPRPSPSTSTRAARRTAARWGATRSAPSRSSSVPTSTTSCGGTRSGTTSRATTATT